MCTDTKTLSVNEKPVKERRVRSDVALGLLCWRTISESGECDMPRTYTKQEIEEYTGIPSASILKIENKFKERLAAALKETDLSRLLRE